MITTAALEERSSKELGQMAKAKGIAGWHSLRKAELVKALMKEARKSANRSKAKASAASKAAGKQTAAKAKPAKRSAVAKGQTGSKSSPTTSKAKQVPTSRVRTGKAASAKTSARVTSSRTSKSKTNSPKTTATKSSSAKSASPKSPSSRSTKAGAAGKRTVTVAHRPKTSTRAIRAASNGRKTAAEPVKAAGKRIAGKTTDSKTTDSKTTASSTKPATAVASQNGRKKARTRLDVGNSPGLANRSAKTPTNTNTSPAARKKIQYAQENRERLRDLATAKKEGNSDPVKDRIILIVRDAYWMQAHWELTRATIDRAQVALAEQWHTAKPVLRVYEIEDDSTTNTSERAVRDIEIHGEVTDWYFTVPAPDTCYRIAIGYRSDSGKFHVVSRSNRVFSPAPGGSDSLDENWTDIAENCEKIFAQSGGFDVDNSDSELRELFEERLRRPMGSPIVTRFGMGADGILNRKRDFKFEVDAEMIIYGSTHPTAYVTLAGEPVRLRPDGTFTVRLSMPDRRQVLPVVASSSDGVEQHTTVLAVERNTKVMEPYIKESSD